MSLRKRTTELYRRNQERPRSPTSWFTHDESSMVAVLADLIVPSDGHSPGAKDAKVTESLESLIVTSPNRKDVYWRGLYAFERWAQRQYGKPFCKLPMAQQIELLKHAEQQYQSWSNITALSGRIRRKVQVLVYKWDGLFPVVELAPLLVRDVMQVFYTNELSWKWLGYDGPPMPHGYPFLSERQAETRLPELSSHDEKA